MSINENKYHTRITSQHKWFHLNLKEGRVNRNIHGFTRLRLIVRDYDIEEFGTKVGYVLEENCL